MSYTYNIYKTWEKVKSKYTMRICSLREHTLKHEWNQMVWSVNNLRCGTAAARAGSTGIAGFWRPPPEKRQCFIGRAFSRIREGGQGARRAFDKALTFLGKGK